MENASKALLIVAAVLIVILLISIGFRIFNPSQNVQEQVNHVGEKVSETVKNLSTNTVAELKGNLLKIESEFVVNKNYKRIKVNLEPGKYKLSVENIDTNGPINRFLVLLCLDREQIGYYYFEENYKKGTITIDKKVDNILVYAQNTYNNSVGYTTTYKNLMLEKID